MATTESESVAAAELETGQNGILTLSFWDSESVLIPGKAIFTLLQPPKVRTGPFSQTFDSPTTVHMPPTTRDIPPVTLTNITHVDVAEFSSYITQFSAIYEQLQRLRESEDGTTKKFYRRNVCTNDSTTDDNHLQPGQQPSVSKRGLASSVSCLSQLEVPSVTGKSSRFARRATQEPPPLSTIPRVYFDKDFHLQNPRTFDVVSERSEVVQPMGLETENAAMPRKALATNAILQDKMSWYLDITEMYLISSISVAATAFFAALGSLWELHLEAARSVEQTKALREEIEALDKEISTSGLQIVQKRRRRQNLQPLHDAVLQLKHVVDGVATCKTLVDNGEVEKALETIDSLESIMAGKSDLETPLKIDGRNFPLRDLRAVPALQGVRDDLNKLRNRIGKAFETRFLSFLMGDLRRHSDAVSAEEVLVRWAAASARSRGGRVQKHSVLPSYINSTDGLRSELLEILTGLHRARYLTTAVSAYKEGVLREIANLVRRPLPHSNNDDNDSVMSSSTMTSKSSQQHKSSILGHNLRALGPEDAEELFIGIYMSVTETLRRFSTQVKILLDITSSLSHNSGHRIEFSEMESLTTSTAAKKSSISATLEVEEIHEVIDLQNLLGQAVDIAQEKVAKLLRVRSERITDLSLVWFLRYFSLNLHFVNECELISGRCGTPLNAVINEQIKIFAQQHDKAEQQKLAQGMESDQWYATYVSERDMAELSRILSCTKEDPAEWSNTLKLWVRCADEHNRSDEAADPPLKADGKIRSVSIDEEEFVLPHSAIVCMNGVAHFLQLIVGIPSMTGDIGASLVSYLELFNKRCAQLILGAGARQSAGLKNITSKHLVLASRALGFIATLISHITGFVRRHARSTDVAPTLVHFVELRRLYQEHVDSLHAKIVEIMSRLAASHAKTMRNIDWDDSQTNVHPHMATLAKDTMSLHRILTKTLPEATILRLMDLVFSSYKDQLGTAFRDVDPKTDIGRDSMLRDIEFFQTKLGGIDGCSEAGGYLTAIVKSKLVKGVTMAGTE
ncbi:GARP complex component [Pochonia chlamydosporia 170]|uniref:GARP complex component n=1 Tax=Pochonia chlamydosporia 170 TaxID=1380566 RepID=A0A179F5D9_METCM|nr:GARP complex component [Pochonia chlamydosporia 170]OAQ60646.1 GARP complex component [Pochonia chlamydosporia 170]